MALAGTERVRIVGLIKGGPAATEFDTTAQNIANLRTGALSPLSGSEVIPVRGVASTGGISPVPFDTSVHAIGALGSLAPSTLVGTEIVLVGPVETGSLPSSVKTQTTTLAIANS